MSNPPMESLRFDERGLIPAIIQDAETGTVLMLAYMNRESLTLTLETGQTHFWSRSRNMIWHKGETSANVQDVLSVKYDCDSDALLVTVNQHGGACHTGEHSCFFNSLRELRPASPNLGGILGKLAGVIRRRKVELPEGSGKRRARSSLLPRTTASKRSPGRWRICFITRSCSWSRKTSH